MKETYGITLEEYDQLFEEQGGVCAICAGRRNYRLDVDHSHETGIIRGLLCKTCNRHLLPAARDSEHTLNMAAMYLKQARLKPPFGGRKVNGN